MAQYERILLPVDGTDETTDAVDHAMNLADSSGAAVHLLYVVDERRFTDPAPLLPDVTDVRTEELLAQYRDEGEAALARIADSIAERRPDVETATVIAQGVPHEVIRRYAREEGMDAVVMMTHQRTDRERELLGSVTERVIRTCDVPVFVIPPTDGKTVR